MDIIHETITFKEKQNLTVSIQTLKSCDFHWHDCIELLLVLSGTIKVTLESDSYLLSEDDILVINQGQVHNVSGDHNVVTILYLNLNAFSPFIDASTVFHCNSSTSPDQKDYLRLKKIIAQIISAKYNEKQHPDLYITSYAYQLVITLLKDFESKKKDSNVHALKNIQKISRICQYINEHYTENLSLNKIAENEFFSPSYFSHLFKESMGISFFNYLSDVRIKHAVNDLTTTTLSMEQIAANNGFSNYRYFVKAFKNQYGMLPKDYRKNAVKPETTTPVVPKEEGFMLLKKHDFLNKLGHYLNESIADSPTIDIKESYATQIDVTHKGRLLKHNFRTLTSVGRAKEILYADIQEELRQIQKDVKFQYIVFHGILDDSMMLYNEDRNGQPYLTFYYIDLVLDFLRSIELKPLLQLSFMPKTLAKDPKHSIFYNPVILSEPKDEKKWCFLITGLTNHLIERYGLSEVRSWLFTFWNAPYKSYIFSFASEETNRHLYQVTYDCVKKCDSLIPFGAPSYGPLYFDESEYYEFLDFCKTNRCYPDFYTFHMYPVENATDRDLATFGESKKKTMITLSQDSDSLAHALETIRLHLKKYPERPLYITEWAPTTSHRDWLNDTCYRSCFVVKNTLENYDMADSFCNWMLSDSVEEMPYDNELFHGELGLFTNYQIKKPAYYAYCFLTHLKNILVTKGNGYFVTKDSEGNLAIVLYHYIPISPLYAKGILFNVTSTTRYNAFVDVKPKNMHLLLNNLANGPYQMSEQILNRDSGSAYDEWIKMGALPLTTKEELAVLRSRSTPVLIKSSVTVTNHLYEYTVPLSPHEVRLIELKRI